MCAYPTRTVQACFCWHTTVSSRSRLTLWYVSIIGRSTLSAASLVPHGVLYNWRCSTQVVQMGDTYSKTLLKSTKQLIVKGVVEKSHVNLIDDTQNTSTNDAGTKEKPRATTPPPSTRKRPSTPPKRSPAVEPASSSPKVAPARKAAVKAAAVEGPSPLAISTLHEFPEEFFPRRLSPQPTHPPLSSRHSFALRQR